MIFTNAYYNYNNKLAFTFIGFLFNYFNNLCLDELDSNLYETWFGRLIVKVSRPYLSLFENLPLQIWGLDFTILVALIVLQFVQRFIIIVFNGVFH